MCRTHNHKVYIHVRGLLLRCQPALCCCEHVVRTSSSLYPAIHPCWHRDTCALVTVWVRMEIPASILPIRGRSDLRCPAQSVYLRCISRPRPQTVFCTNYRSKFPAIISQIDAYTPCPHLASTPCRRRQSLTNRRGPGEEGVPPPDISHVAGEEVGVGDF